MITRQQCIQWDQENPFSAFQQHFTVPNNNIFLDGVSVGPKLKSAIVLDNDHKIENKNDDQIIMPSQQQTVELYSSQQAKAAITYRMGRLLNVPANQIRLIDAKVLNFFKILSIALYSQAQLQNNHAKTILIEQDLLPIDRFGLKAYLKLKHPEYRLMIIDTFADFDVDLVQGDIALVVLAHVNARTSYRYDMAQTNAKIHRKGALALWELSYSIGTMPIDLLAAQVDFAIGRNSKFLNGGIEAPALIWANPQYQNSWIDELDRAYFSQEYPNSMSLNYFERALRLFDRLSLEQIRQQSERLSACLITLIKQQCASYSGMLQISPEDSQQRGSHLSWQHPKAHYIVAALMARGVVVDFYNTDILRIGLSPLYLNFEQLWCMVQHLVEIVQFELWDQPFTFNYAV